MTSQSSLSEFPKLTGKSHWWHHSRISPACNLKIFLSFLLNHLSLHWLLCFRHVSLWHVLIRNRDLIMLGKVAPQTTWRSTLSSLHISVWSGSKRPRVWGACSPHREWWCRWRSCWGLGGGSRVQMKRVASQCRVWILKPLQPNFESEQDYQAERPGLFFIYSMIWSLRLLQACCNLTRPGSIQTGPGP